MSNKIKLGLGSVALLGSLVALSAVAADALNSTGLEPTAPMTESSDMGSANTMATQAANALDTASSAVLKAQEATEAARIASDAAKVSSDVAKIATDKAVEATEEARKATEAAGGPVVGIEPATDSSGTMSTDMGIDSSKDKKKY